MQSGRRKQPPSARPLDFSLPSVTELPQGDNISESADHQHSYSRSRCDKTQCPGIPQDVPQQLSEPSKGTLQAKPDIGEAEYRNTGSDTRRYTESPRNCSRSWAYGEDRRGPTKDGIIHVLEKIPVALPAKTSLTPAPFIVDLDSGLDDQTPIAALQKPSDSDMEEEERRIRYFEAMDVSLDRRLSDVIQLQSEEDLDSDDDDNHERLITPGTLVEPDAWPMETSPAGFALDGTRGESSLSGSDLCAFERPVHPPRITVLKQTRNETASGACLPSSVLCASPGAQPYIPQDLDPERVHIANMGLSVFPQNSRMSPELSSTEYIPPFGHRSPASIISSKSPTCQVPTSGKATVRTSGIMQEGSVDD